MNTCLVIEDSRLARKEIVTLLEKIGVFGEIFEAKDATEATKVLKDTDPDAMFLDIHMPGMNGFEFLESLSDFPPVIFTTAYDEYAIKSFDFNAIDYILKPIKMERLEKAIEKLNLQETSEKKSDKLEKQVFVRDGERCWFVQLKNIRVFESVGNYSRIYFDDQKPMIQKSLNYLESVLDESTFFRVNRQQIINLNFVEKMDTWFNGKLKLVLKTGETIEVSRRQSQKIKNNFSF